MHSWYVLFVETGKEDLTQKWIDIVFNCTECHSLIPKRKLTERKGGKKITVLRNLFPGYVFIKILMSEEVYYKLCEIPRVYCVLNNGSYWTNVCDNEMSLILKLTDTTGIIDYSIVKSENSQIIIKQGPLVGLEAIIIKLDKHRNRVTVEIDFMGQPRLVDLGIEMLYA